MLKLELTEKSRKILDKLIEVTTYIKEIYAKLLRLELNNKKGVEYQSLLDELLIKLCDERYIYNQIDRIGASCIYDYIIQNMPEEEKYRPLENIATENYSGMIITRIVAILSRKAIISEDEMFEIVCNSIKEAANYSMLSCSIISDDLIELALEKRLLLNYIMVLSTYEGKYKDYLTGSKYYTAFTNPDIEAEMITSSFEFSSMQYDSVVYASDPFTEEDFKDLDKKYVSSYFIEFIYMQMSALIAITDDNMESELEKVNAKIRELLIRGALINLHTNELGDINENFISLTSNPSNERMCASSSTAIEMIKNALKNVSKDKKLKKAIK